MSRYGRNTGKDLSDVEALFLPRITRNGKEAPPFSTDAAKLALEMSITAYDFEMDDWLDAGWTDISMQVDNKLLTGVRGAADRGRWRQVVMNEWLPYLARLRARRINPISQVRGALRQRDGCDTGKAIIMVKRAKNGRAVVAISVMGTGRRLYDWFSNFKFRQRDGLHEGFLELAEQLESNAKSISFPQTAAEMGRETLTLSDVMKECGQPDSPFLLFLTGHSQGGAVIQTLTYKMLLDGALPRNLLGYGFASPTTAAGTGELKMDAGEIPLYHIINSDDVTPRVGASIHLGQCRVYPANDPFRQKCYNGAWDDPAFREMLSFVYSVRKTEDGILYALALTRALMLLPEEHARELSRGLLSRYLPERLMSLLSDERMQKGVKYVERRLLAGYESVTGREIQEEKIKKAERMSARIGDLALRAGAASFAKLQWEALSEPHAIVGKDAPYLTIVRDGFDQLTPALWCGESAPMWDVRAAAPSIGVKKTRAPRAMGGYSAARARRNTKTGVR